jgi:hypothetical protein
MHSTLPEPPALPVAEELVSGRILDEPERRQRKKAWRQVQRGLTVILLAWTVLTLLGTFLLVGLAYQFVHVLGSGGPPLPLAVPGVLGVVVVVVEFAALRGYGLCLGAPPEERLRDWIWVAMGVTVARNCACLGASVLFLMPGAVSDRTLVLTTVLAAGLFMGQLFVTSLMLRAIAYAQKSHWILRMVWNSVYINLATLLGWSFLFCLLFVVVGPSAAAGPMTGEYDSVIARLIGGCGGLVLSGALFLCLLWHLRVLYHLRNTIET